MIIQFYQQKLNEVLISKALINQYINQAELISKNNVLTEYNQIKQEIKNPETSLQYTEYKYGSSNQRKI